MTDTAVAAEETPVEITELEKIEAERVDGVKHPANGTPILMMKALPDAPPAPQAESTPTPAAPGIDVAELAKAVAAELAKDSRTFSADQRSKQADQGNALPDGSYPIPDADALRRAAILARSKHGNYKAARKLIARRAKELGVPNPLKSDTAGKSVLADQPPGVNTEGAGTGDLAEVVKAAVAEATKASEERVKALETQLAKVLAQPIPGGPVTSIAVSPHGAQKLDDRAAKAAYYRDMAETMTDPKDADGYRQLARQLEEQPAETAQA